jgi:8-oxo-dGTP pyrophosphatase MutT (NUDIX family)
MIYRQTKYVKSVGAIILNQEKRVLIVLQKENHYWEFPKGKVEASDKDEIATLKREIFEETGLKNFKIVKGFKNIIRYNFVLKNNFIKKNNIFYLVYVENPKIQLSEEHLDYKWVSLVAVNRYFKHKSQRILVYKLREFLGDRVTYGTQVAPRR